MIISYFNDQFIVFTNQRGKEKKQKVRIKLNATKKQKTVII
jgi:hypothetical protein